MCKEATIVDGLYVEFTQLATFLREANEVSFGNTIDDSFRKSILLAAASYFEHCVCDHILQFVKQTTSDNNLVSELVRNKAISRQYHTMFDWEQTANANKFYRLFGQEFTDFMKQEIAKDSSLASAVTAFLELGRDRNRLVHQNYATFSLEKTAEEIYHLYTTARLFVDCLPGKMRTCSQENECADSSMPVIRAEKATEFGAAAPSARDEEQAVIER